MCVVVVVVVRGGVWWWWCKVMVMVEGCGDGGL